jgi:hypothetical protein
VKSRRLGLGDEILAIVHFVPGNVLDVANFNFRGISDPEAIAGAFTAVEHPLVVTGLHIAGGADRIEEVRGCVERRILFPVVTNAARRTTGPNYDVSMELKACSVVRLSLQHEGIGARVRRYRVTEHQLWTLGFVA